MFIMQVIKPVGIRNTAANGRGMHTHTHSLALMLQEGVGEVE